MTEPARMPWTTHRVWAMAAIGADALLFLTFAGLGVVASASGPPDPTDVGPTWLDRVVLPRTAAAAAAGLALWCLLALLLAGALRAVHVGLCRERLHRLRGRRRAASFWRDLTAGGRRGVTRTLGRTLRRAARRADAAGVVVARTLLDDAAAATSLRADISAAASKTSPGEVRQVRHLPAPPQVGLAGASTVLVWATLVFGASATVGRVPVLGVGLLIVCGVTAVRWLAERGPIQVVSPRALFTPDEGLTYSGQRFRPGRDALLVLPPNLGALSIEAIRVDGSSRRLSLLEREGRRLLAEWVRLAERGAP